MDICHRVVFEIARDKLRASQRGRSSNQRVSKLKAMRTAKLTQIIPRFSSYGFIHLQQRKEAEKFLCVRFLARSYASHQLSERNNGYHKRFTGSQNFGKIISRGLMTMKVINGNVCIYQFH